MITINNLPLVKKDKFDLFSNDIYGDKYYLKPEYKYLPDFTDMNEEEKLTYNLKDIEEDVYLIGIEVISDGWVSPGFMSTLFECYGLILEESYPIEQKNKNKVTQTYVYLNFKHIIESLNEKHYTVKLPKKSK